MDKFSNCGEYLDNVDDMLAEYKDRFCDGDQLNDELAQLVHSMRCLLNDTDVCDCDAASCSWADVKDQMQECYFRWYNDVLFDYSIDPTEMMWARQLLRRLGKSVLRCVRNRLELNAKPQCDAKSRDAVIWYNLIYVMAPGPDVVFDDARQWVQFLNRTTVVAFGDPHFTLFDGSIVTCSSLHWQNFLRTQHLEVRAFNVPADETGDADTALFAAAAKTGKVPSIMSKIKLVFFDNDGNEIARYSAEHGKLPRTLIHIGGQSSDDFLIRVDKTGTHLTIKYFSAGIALDVYAYGKFYNIMGVRMGNLELSKGSGLMIKGCSKNELIDVELRTDGEGNLNMADLGNVNDEDRRRKRASGSECQDACAASYAVHKSIGDTCLYDCAATGSAELAVASNPTSVEANLKTMDEEMYDHEHAVVHATALGGKPSLMMADNGASSCAIGSVATFMVIGLVCVLIG